MRRVIPWCCLLLLAAAGAGASGCAHEHDVTSKRQPPHPPPIPYHLHLNGIGGYRFIDKYMLVGLQEGGLRGEVKAYDWTGSDVGLVALLASERHHEQAHEVAQLIIAASNAQMGRRITLSCHSAGCGIAMWALAELPEEVTVDSVVMLQSALSPGYDLTPALRHVTGKVYSFYSPYDGAVLGLGTKMFGTVDGPKTEAAGKVGFIKPPTADPQQYAKLVQIPYDSAWMKLGNIGDHIGPMSRAFAREVIAPVLLTGVVPRIGPTPRGGDKIKFPPPPPTSTPAASTIPSTMPAVTMPSDQ